MKSSISLMPISHRSVLTIAVPIMLSNVTEPLIGVVNTAVIGQLPEAYYIGAISIGSLIFSFLFWGFGFLRLSTGGLSAQAVGAAQGSLDLAVVYSNRRKQFGAPISSFQMVQKMLADMAVKQPEAFAAVASQAKSALSKQATA